MSVLLTEIGEQLELETGGGVLLLEANEVSYLSIVPLQEPFDVGPDEAGRVQWSFNVLATKRPSATFVKELAWLLEAAGVGMGEVDIFATSQAAIPEGDGPYLHVRPTAGTAPLGTHNDGPGAYRRPGAQIIVTGRSSAAAEVMARAAWEALVAVRNRAVEVPA